MIIKKNFKQIVLLTIFYLFFVFLNRNYFFQNFKSDIISNYLRSQDILDQNDQIKDRIFVSDDLIYQATGYLYANGEKPQSYNFQHPPLIKYLFGYGAKIFNLPLLPNLIFAFVLLLEIYLLGILVFKNKLVGLLASTIVLFDPVFKEVSIYALLDLGQMVFILAFLISTIFYEKHTVASGIFLGLAMASKFYSPVLIFLALIYIYKITNKKIEVKKELVTLLTAFLVFNFIYINAYPYNPFFYQAKIIKFMLVHNKAESWGGILKMFFEGFILWPVSFFVTIYSLAKVKIKSTKFIFLFFPVIYFVIMTFQIPFTRYFILILPFLYIGLSSSVVEKIKL